MKVTTTIAEARWALDEVRRSNAKLGEFAGRVSHDLRIPLTTILGYVELSEDDPDLPPEHPAAEYLNLIGASGRRMLAMLEDVLDYSKVGGALHPQPVSLRTAVLDAARDLGIPFGSGGDAGLGRRAAARRGGRPATAPRRGCRPCRRRRAAARRAGSARG